MLNDDFIMLQCSCYCYTACMLTGFSLATIIAFYKKYGFDQPIPITQTQWSKCLPIGWIGAGAGAGAATIGLLLTFVLYLCCRDRSTSNTPQLLENRDPEAGIAFSSSESSSTDSDGDPNAAAKRPLTTPKSHP